MTVRYFSTKTFTHEAGFSCAFRQWRADSHCKLLHGYALSIRVDFEASSLDDRNWVVDFGDLKWLKNFLASMFDHTTIVAYDDPHYKVFEDLYQKGIIDMRTRDAVGCEAFAVDIYTIVDTWVKQHFDGRVVLRKVEVREHGANSAGVINDHPLTSTGGEASPSH